MQENWKSIREFPAYEVSDLGRVRNVEYDRPKEPSMNQAGILHYLFMKNGQQYRRGVAGLVAEAFLNEPKPDHFNALIHLDGDRTNCAVENLMWRPRWFSRKYHQQFHPDAPRGFNEPVREAHSGEVFNTSWDAAVTYGLIDSEIKLAALNHTHVFPTGQIFHTMRE